MRSAILEMVQLGDVDQEWAKSDQLGEVAIALRTDVALEEPRLYSYLPMGPRARLPLSERMSKHPS